MTATTDSLRLAVHKEASPGVEPTTPTYDLIRPTGEGLTFEPVKVESAEITGDSRGIADEILAGSNIQGAINFELSKHDALEGLLAAVLGSDWGSDPGLAPALTADQAVDRNILSTYLLEKRFQPDPAVTAYDFQRFAGCVANSLSFAITPDEPITGSMGFLGRTMGSTGAEIGSSTYIPAAANEIMTAPLVTGLYLADYGTTNAVSWMANACITEASFDLQNNIRAIKCISQQGVARHLLGKFNCSINCTMLYEGRQALDAMIANTKFAFIMNLTDGTNEYRYRFPACKISSNPVVAGGAGQDLVNPLRINMLKDGSPSYTAFLERV